MMRVPCVVCSDRFARALTCMFWVGGVRRRPWFDKLVTGDTYVIKLHVAWWVGSRCVVPC